MAIQMRIETVTPEMAAAYLKRNVDNYRKISKSKVQLYAEEMKAGKWQLNGEGIMFDSAGNLKNGQHRLAAVMLAKVPVQMTLITGVADDVSIYDSGMMRSTAQIAQASGCEDITRIECAAGTAIVGRFSQVSKGIVIDWLKTRGADVRKAYKLCAAGNTRNLSRRASVVLAAYLMFRLSEMKDFEIETFFKIFNTGNTVGTDGYEPSSALVARRMFEDRYKGAATTSRVIREQAEIIILAMSDFQKGKTRQMNYQLKEPLKCLEMVDKIRREDGLTK